ncbi:hypothetical protein HOH45_01185 [bacterium]|jgi:hypothetical protein|nr:hypothetical protein [bacterium]
MTDKLKYLGLMAIILLFFISIQAVYVKTQSLHEKNREMSIQINKLKKENHLLYLSLLAKTNLQEIDKKVSKDLGMMRPKKINYILVQKDELSR